MKTLSKIYRLKEGSVGKPERYLGANVGKYQLPDGRESWSVSARDYLKTAVTNIEENLKKKGERLKANVSSPLPFNYKPELDISEPCSPSQANEYQQLIGILRWSCELGRIDILLETSWLSSYNAAPRRGHLEAVYHIFAYLKAHLNSTLVFDEKEPILNEASFSSHDWSEFYDVEEDPLPPKMPTPRGNRVIMSCFVDANHAGNLLTRRSQTGFLIFLNKAPIVWFSKRQPTVESSTFGSEFVALRSALESIEALRYKL